MIRADIYRKAIELMEDMELSMRVNDFSVGYACNAIEVAQGRHPINEAGSEAAKIFYDTFLPEDIDPEELKDHGFWGSMTLCKDATQERIIALGLMLAMVESGDA